MKPTDLDLPAMRKPIREALRAYADMYRGDVKFGDFHDMQLTPEKPNSARTTVPVAYKGLPPLDMYAIAFLPGDGTGDTSTYKLDDVFIPTWLQYAEKPERVIPRSKKGIACEGFFPLFSAAAGRNYMFVNCMWELTIADSAGRNVVTHAWWLGSRPDRFKVLDPARPEVYFTTGTGKNGERFGDPHAIHYNPNAEPVQVVGFLAIKDAEHPIMEITGNWKLPPRYDK
ncbi:MAG: hypothetical protein HY517_02315 [Candidatus Aenigmarchaeota archaeon]|nr:hypothetical protein [Candidatus Aenigmarchaeota archaeon]